MEVDIIPSRKELVENIGNWCTRDYQLRKGKNICLSNVHMCIETKDNAKFKEVVNASSLVLPDGKPLCLCQKLLGAKQVRQIRGTDLTLRLCRLAQEKGYKIGLYGGTNEVLELMHEKLHRKFPELNIALSISPPFRPLSEEENQSYVEQINHAEVDILFVGIGCPKQEIWMNHNRDQLKCVMLGVGAAFDFISGRKVNAPVILQKMYLEWLFRLLMEPARLWARYLIYNPRFIYLFSKNYKSAKKRGVQTKH
ncbi:MAG: WecB/TagA/CpsF family glycosyltransferase [Planctomycetes bacterium]|nr:WecB/TagA/CpsF family glycosyltransferase [Planctomycetota bacterium]